MVELEQGAVRHDGPEPTDDSLRYAVSGSTGYTVEAQIGMLGRFASSARRAAGLRGLVARALVLVVLVPLLLGVLWGVVTLPLAFR